MQKDILRPTQSKAGQTQTLAHQNRTTAIASDFRIDGAKSLEIPQEEMVLGLRSRNSKSQIASGSGLSIAPLNRNAKSPKSLAISGVRDGHRNRKSEEIAAMSAR